MLFSPGFEDFYRDALSEGFAREGARRSFVDFDVMAPVPFMVTDDIPAALDTFRPFYALYLGGMGAKGENFHANVAIRMGYEKEVTEIQDLYLAGKKEEAGAKIPASLMEELALVGSKEKIRDDLAKWRESLVTTIGISGDAETLRAAAELVLD
jgi:alkanesulfonate monooxygenase SsuD/methylene tetrahydromethanopterin reductase-like flavin-dependent oxidoreductase (luciferase family)